MYPVHRWTALDKGSLCSLAVDVCAKIVLYILCTQVCCSEKLHCDCYAVSTCFDTLLCDCHLKLSVNDIHIIMVCCTSPANM